MIETNKLIYIQMQKTGCTRIGEIITQLCGGKPLGRKHGTLAHKPNKFIVGSIRNPWAWYVSLWAFGCEGRGGVLSWLKDDPDWQRVYSDASDPNLFRQWLKMVYSEKYLSLMQNGYNQFNLAPDVGLMTWRYAYLYLAHVDTNKVPLFLSYNAFVDYDSRFNMVDWFVRLEAMPESIMVALNAAGYTAKMSDLIRLCQRKSNTSDQLPYQEYYDHDSRELVREHERLIIDRFEYDET